MSSTSSLNVEIGSTFDCQLALDTNGQQHMLRPDTKKCMDTEIDMKNFPIKIRPKFSKNAYIDEIRQFSRLNLKSEMQKIEIEKQQIALAEEKIVQQQGIEDTKNLMKNFDKFLSQSYDKAFKVTQNAIEAAKVSTKLAVEKQSLEEKVDKLKADLIYLEEKWNDYLKYQKFLFSLSPSWWRQLNSAPDNSELLPPVLYFTKPEEVFHVFQRKTQQSLRLFSKSEQLASELNFLKRELEMTEIERGRKRDRLQKEANDLNQKIRFEEETVMKYKKLAINLINGPFHDIVTDPKAIKLHVLIQDVYEAIISNNDTNLNMKDMIKALEMYFSNVLIDLNSYPKEVAKIENETILKDKRAMKEAVQAARKIKESEMMMKSLKRAIAEDVQKALRIRRKRLMFRSFLPKFNHKIVEKSLKLTKDEFAFLRYFSNYCRRCGDNPEDFLLNFSKF